AVRQGHRKEMPALAEWLGAPVLSSANGRGTIPTDHPLFVGTHTYLPACRELLEGADLVLAIGTRFQAVATWYWSLPMPALVHIDVDAAAFHRNYRAEVAVQGDAALAARWLLQNGRAPAIDPGHLAEADRAREGIDAAQLARIGPDHAAICESMDRHLPTGRNLVCDATMAANTWGLFRLPVREPRSLAYSTSLAIGPALPLGIGAALGSGRKTVIVHGDGGVMLNLGELAVAAESGAPVIVLVFDDHGYGVLRQLQSAAGMPHAGVDLCTPDFAALGNAMGVPSVRVADAMAFDAAFADAAAAEGPRLIEIDMRGLAPLSL
ncbi:MAG: thiamine pyrophosphate-dependent enzyme, partial [Gammaproteobacteria bacterium]